VTVAPVARGRLARRAGPLFALAVVAAVAFGLVAPVAGLAPAGQVRAASSDLTLVTDAIYTVIPSRHRVHVSMSVTAHNHRGETRTHKYYFDHAFLAVPSGTTGYAFSGSKGSSVGVAQRLKDATLLRLNFGPRLYGGATRTYRLAFDIVDRGKPAARQVRIGTSLVTFPVWSFASDGASGSRVRVKFPAGYAVKVESGRFDTSTRTSDGGTQLATQPLGDPLTFFAYVSGERNAVYRDRAMTVDADGQAIALMLRPWQDDKTWASRIGGLFSKALPVMRDDIGIAWPETQPVVVQEAVSRSAGGYAGLFDPAERRIEVAYWAAPLVALHEAAHGWFNGGLLADRWASEGFASLYAQRAAKRLKQADTSPRLTDAVRRAAIPLNAWANVSPDGEVDRAAETYGYAASLALARAVAQRAGNDALRRVWADAASGKGAYQPVFASGAPADPFAVETVDGPPDWRGLLDLLEAETGKDFTDLWRRWVVRPNEAGLLDVRAAAQTAYARTLAVAGDWRLPQGIRDALRAWQFDAATSQMADARTVLAQRGAIESLAATAGIQLPPSMRQRFEAGDMAGASSTAERMRNGILAIQAAEAVKASGDDVLSRIGMVGEDPETAIAAARTSLEAGDVEAAQASSDVAYRAWNGAWQEGRRRALLALAVVASMLVLVAAVAGRARVARRNRASSVGART
jgi:hypothetical protein